MCLKQTYQLTARVVSEWYILLQVINEPHCLATDKVGTCLENARVCKVIMTITVQHVLTSCLVCGYCFFDFTSVYKKKSNCTEQPSTRLASQYCRPSEANLDNGGETTYLCTTLPWRMLSNWLWISRCGDYWQQAELHTDGARRIMMMMTMVRQVKQQLWQSIGHTLFSVLRQRLGKTCSVSPRN